VSQLDERSQTIDGIRFEFKMLPPRKAARIMVELTKLLGPAVGNAADSVGGGGIQELMEKDVSAGMLSGILGGISDRLDPDKLDNLMDEFSRVTFVKNGDKKPLLNDVFDSTFAGKPGTMFRWLAASIKHNYADFFVGWGDVLGRLPGKGA
jgi:hypothetical protein